MTAGQRPPFGLRHRLTSLRGSLVPSAALLAGRAPSVAGAVVLAYHDIEQRPSAHYSVTPQQLRDHLALLEFSGREIVHLDRLVHRLEQGQSLDGLAAVTFDDGLLGLHRHGLEVLRDTRVPATLFAVTDGLGTRPAWVEGAGRLLTVSELQDVHEAGVRVASHTCTHPSLPNQGPDRQNEELRRSAAWLEDRFGDPVNLLAYPFGHHDPDLRTRVAARGYRAAFTFVNGAVTTTTDRLRIPRLTMWRGLGRLRLAYHLSRSPAAWPDQDPDAAGISSTPM